MVYLLVVLAYPPVTLRSADWSQRRGSGHNNVAPDGESVPAEWTATKVVEWKSTAYYANLWPRRRIQSPYSIAPASQNPPRLFENCSNVSGRGHLSPIVVGDLVVLTSADRTRK